MLHVVLHVLYLQTARKIHIAKFRSKKACLLITTDVAARGIDIPLIDNVVNYDFPAKPELFIHRVGRAARCVSLCVMGHVHVAARRCRLCCSIAEAHIQGC